MDFDWKVESISSFLMFLVSLYDILYGNVGFLFWKSDMCIKSFGLGSWFKIGGWVIQFDFINGLFFKNDGSFIYDVFSGDLKINYVGIYFLLVNVIVLNIFEFCEVIVCVFDSNGGEI